MSEKETPQDSNSSNALPPKRPMTVHILKNATKKETSRIELADAEAPTEAPGETLSVGDVAGSQSQDVAKSATSRVQLSDAETEIPEGSVPNAKDATARIILGDGSKPYSGSIHPAAKDATVRVDLTGLLERDASAGSEADQTARIDIPGMVSPAAPPRTVRLQRPGIS
ncbi:MAG: hypothetical protein U1E27_05955, partial [Kiritimatiellia bacterium]|nr:hypothetical protein [Kiritimatiellia bacterium]